ncbi:MAG: (Fe-S)-binding protein [Chloroflexi bacterium]|nr:(Fe-S)-binding protein [Chloroflexota bacterium]
MEPVAIFKEGIDALAEAGAEQVKLCFQCSLCTSSCPWNSVRSFVLRRMLRQAQFGLVELESEEWWRCTTCGLCTSRCPRGVPIIDIMMAVRRILVSGGMEPSSIHSAFTSLATLGNPWSQPAGRRTDWAKGMAVRDFAPGMQWLYFPCCTSAYDPRARSIARSTAKVLMHAGVDFGILGNSEVCCGESARKAGNERVFQSLAQTNIKNMGERGVEGIIVSSPHCYHAFKNDYPPLGYRVAVLHSSEMLAQLVGAGKLNFSREQKVKVAYHDPCYLGRHSGVYDPPRTVLRSLPGIELVEMADSRQTALCCGAGGGRIWQETRKGERLADLRLAQAAGAGVDVMATACPYCLVNFESSVKDAEGPSVQVKDLSELVAEAL